MQGEFVSLFLSLSLSLFCTCSTSNLCSRPNTLFIDLSPPPPSSPLFPAPPPPPPMGEAEEEEEEEEDAPNVCASTPFGAATTCDTKCCANRSLCPPGLSSEKSRPF